MAVMMNLAVTPFRVPCQKCENCLKKDCGKCVPCKEMKKSASLIASNNSSGKSPTNSKPPEKLSLKICTERACLKLQLSPSAECAICRTRSKSNVLMECTSCCQVTHPGCVKSNVSGVISSNEDNYWVCPSCCKRQCTAFCDEPCPHIGKHHELLAKLIEVGDFSASDDQSRLKYFKECVLKHIKAGWNCDLEPVPDISPKLRLPIMHLAVMLGKVKALEWLLQQGFVPQYVFIEGQLGLCSPLHVAVTHLEAGVTTSRGRKEVQINRFAHIVHLFLLNCPLCFTYKQSKTQNSFLHFLCQQCLENGEGLSKDYLLATLQKLKEFRSKAKEICIKDVMCASNAEGNTFLHLIVQNDVFHDIVRFLSSNFDDEIKRLSGITNKCGDTPRMIAADKGSIKVCQALGAPDALLTSLIEKKDSVEVQVREADLKKLICEKRKRSEEQQVDKLRKRKKISKEGKKTVSFSVTSTQLSDSDTSDNEKAHRNENNKQATLTCELETQRGLLPDKRSNEKVKADSSVCIENCVNQSINVKVSDCNVKSITEQLGQSELVPTQDSQEENIQSVVQNEKASVVNSSEINSFLDRNHTYNRDTIQETKCLLNSRSCDEMEGKSDKNENSHSSDLGKSSQRTAQNDEMCSSRIIEKLDDSLACETVPDESKRNESLGVTPICILDSEEKDIVSMQSEYVSDTSTATVTANGSSLQVNNKHTVFCPDDCAARHSKVLQSLQACNNFPLNTKNKIPVFMEVLDDYLQKEGKSALNRPIPDKVKEFRHPIVHWAAVLGKYVLLSYLAERKDFDLAVKNPNCGDETAMHRAVLFIEEAFTKTEPGVTIQRICTTFSKLTEVFIKEAVVIFSKQNSNGDTPLHVVAKAIVEVGQNRQLKCYDNFFKIMLKKIAQSSKSKFEKVQDILCKTNNDGETFLHVLTCRVGIGHELVKFSLKVLPEQILKKLKNIETRYGKTASAIAEDLGSHKLAADLSPTLLLVGSDSAKGNRAERAARRDDVKVAHWFEQNVAVKKRGRPPKKNSTTPGKHAPSPVVAASIGNPSGATHNARTSYDASSTSSASSGEVWTPVETDLEEDTFALDDVLEMDALPLENTGEETDENIQQLTLSTSNNEEIKEFGEQNDNAPVVDAEPEVSVPVSGGTGTDETGYKTEKVEVESEPIVRADGEGQVTSTSAKSDSVANQSPGSSTGKGDIVDSKQIGKPSSTSKTVGSTPEPTSFQSTSKATPKSTRKPAPSAARAKACIISGIMRSPHSAVVKQSIVKSLQVQFRSTLESAQKSLEEEEGQLSSIRNKCNDAVEKRKELVRQLAEVDNEIAEIKEQERKCSELCEKKQEECDQFHFELEKCESSLQKLSELI